MAKSEVQPALLDRSGAAVYLGVSATTVFRLARAGALPHVKVGDSTRFRIADLDRYIAKNRSTTWGEPATRGGVRAGQGRRAKA